MKLFTELGALVETRWRERNYDESLFAGIAAQALSEANLCQRVDPWEIIRWVHQAPTLPEQMDVAAKFSNPPVTVYAGPRFHIDAYFWLDGTTTIHQHAFSGAFQVLQGSSVHAGYRFAVDREINPHFLTGKLSFRDVTLLTRGDIREIKPGPDFIHSLFHLERPSVTLTIRTYKAPSFPRQFTYLKPCLAINSFFVDVLLVRRVQTVSLLLHSKHPDADKFISDLIDGSDFHTCYAVLHQAFDFLCHRELEAFVGATRSRDRFESLLNRARHKHGALADLLEPVFEEEWRQAEIIRRRAEVKNEDHRFLLALLLNVPERTRLLELVGERYSTTDPVGLVLTWLKELATTKTFGSKDPSVLSSTELSTDHFSVLRIILQESLSDGIARTNNGLEQQDIERIAAELRGLPVLRTLVT